MTRLTDKRLTAIIEALNHRLADELEDSLDRDDYEGAVAWAQEQRAKRAANKKRT